MVLDNFFLMDLPPVLAIFLLSAVLTFLLTIAYKYTTDQKRLKFLKEEQKKLQKEYKQHMKDPKKAMKVNEKLMGVNLEVMKKSFKSTLYTFLPLIFIFAWMNGHMAKEAIYPDQPFTVTAFFEKEATGVITLNASSLQLLSNATIAVGEEVSWELKGKEGKHIILYSYGTELYQQEVLITKEWHYIDPLLEKPRTLFGWNTGDDYPINKESNLEKIQVNLKSIKPFQGVPLLQALNWLWTYILFSLGLSILFRKVMKVY
ncbi:DUF106 domain-containing protein [Candidatus Woesearchaeota archaeon]|nr:MAG: DUF106 domain-containing protein [Candidatus Woesearchaeota archaeon]